MAVIITPTSSAMPTAVITESSEKTRSSIKICVMTLAKLATALPLPCSDAPSSLWWISCVLLPMRNAPPRIRMRSRPEISSLKTVKSGATRLITHVSESSSTIRPNIASASPIVRAFFCWLSGSLPERIEMKTTLSMPSTISRIVSVRRATRASGEVSQSNTAFRSAGEEGLRRGFLRRHAPGD